MKMRKGVLMIFLVLLNSASFFAQQKSFKGMDALAQNNFGTALSLFRQDLNKHPLAAYYGLATYYQSAFALNADSAFYYLEIFDNGWELAEPKLKLKLAEHWAVSDLSITRRFYELASLELKSCDAKPSVEAYERYILRYQAFFQDSESQDRFSSKFDFQGLYQTAILKRDAVAYDLALKDGSANAMLVFVVQYPNAIQVSEAQNRYNNLLYFEKTQTGSEAALIDFIKGFPENPYLDKAWERIYEKYSQEGTIAAFTQFIQTYATAPQLGSAWRQIYRLYMQPYSVEKLAQFKVDYPAYPFLEDLASDSDLLLKKLYPFVQHGYFGYMDTQGKQIIAAQYDDASVFYDGLAIVSKKELFGLINKKNEGITALKFLDISKSTEGFVAEDSAGYYIFSNQGQLLQKEALQWEELQQTLSALSSPMQTNQTQVVSKYERIEKNGKIGLSKRGKILLAAKYDELIYSEDALFILARLGKGLFYFDTTGRRIEINSLDWFLNAAELAAFTKDGIAVFSKAAKLGLMDTKGKVLVKNTFDAAQAIYNDLWPVQQNGKWGLISTSAKVVLPLQYEQIVAFPPFGFLVESTEGVGIWSSAHNWLLKPTFKTVKRFDANYFLVENQEGLGVYNPDGSPLISCSYQRIVRLDDGAFQLINSSGLSYYLPIENKIVELQP
jgi:hypothetical protein